MEKKVKITAETIYEKYQRFVSRGTYGTYDRDDLYSSLGLPLTITYKNYEDQYKRQGLAARIIKAPVNGTWKNEPKIEDPHNKDSEFSKEIETIFKKTSLIMKLRRLDLLATLGQFAILYLGFADGRKPGVPADFNKKISFVTPVPEDRVKITNSETDINSPRYGLPILYEITITDENVDSNPLSTSINMPSSPILVHWSRVIHVAENTLDNDVFGIPALQPIFNRLIGVDKISGAAPEMYFSCARPSYIAKNEPNTDFDDLARVRIQEQLDQYLSDPRRRWLLAEHVDIQTLAAQLVPPTEFIKTQLQLISSATRIPLRILLGSERGELSSNQDERSWLKYLEERRETVADELILRPTIDRLIALQVISPPLSGEYVITWEPLLILSEKEQAEIALLKAQALKTWVDASLSGGDTVLTSVEMQKLLGKTDEEIEETQDSLMGFLSNEDSAREEKTEDEIAETEEENQKEGQ
jgi:hypothetical protein